MDVGGGGEKQKVATKVWPGWGVVSWPKKVAAQNRTTNKKNSPGGYSISKC